MALAKAQLMEAPGGPGILGAVTAGTGIEIVNGVISATGGGGTAASVAVTPIPGIDQATNVQTALEAIELQVQDRIEFCSVVNGGITASISAPVGTSNDGTTLTITTIDASVGVKGVTTLTNDLTGNSESLAITQKAAASLDGKIDALVGANVLAGTYNASTGNITSVTPAGALSGFVVGSPPPAASSVPDNYYILTTVAGPFGPPGAVIPPTGVQSGDWFIVEKEAGLPAVWFTVDFENNAVAAVNVSLAAIPGLSATNVQTGIEQVAAKNDNAITNITATASDGINVTTTPPSPSGRTTNIVLGPATATDLGGVFVQPGQGINLAANGAISLAPPRKVDSISSQFDGSTTDFTIRIGGSAVTPANAESLLVVLGGIVQISDDNYTIAGSTLTFLAPPPAGTSFYGVLFVEG